MMMILEEHSSQLDCPSSLQPHCNNCESSSYDTTRLASANSGVITPCGGDGYEAESTRAPAPAIVHEQERHQHDRLQKKEEEQLRAGGRRAPPRRRAATHDGRPRNRNQSGNQFMKHGEGRSRTRARMAAAASGATSIFIREEMGEDPGAFLEFMNGAGVTETIRNEFRDNFNARPPVTYCSAFHKPANRNKNRSANVPCLDNNRVTLPQNRYIHANWVDSYNKKDAYICTQGPLQHTIEDFWYMVFSNKVKNIVMLTQTNNFHINLCHPYWPENEFERVQFGDFIIRNHKVKEKRYTYLKTTLLVVQKSSRTSMTVHHYRLLSWPTVGVPINTHDLNLTLLEVTNDINERCPVLIHDSDGVGAAAIYITLDVCIRRLKTEGIFDIRRTVELIRTQRATAVHTEDQYLFIFRAMLFHVRGIRGLEANITARAIENEGSLVPRSLSRGEHARESARLQSFENDMRDRLRVERMSRRSNQQLRPSRQIDTTRVEMYEEALRQLELSTDSRLPNRGGGRRSEQLPLEVSSIAPATFQQRLREASVTTRQRVASIQSRLRDQSRGVGGPTAEGISSSSRLRGRARQRASKKPEEKQRLLDAEEELDVTEEEFSGTPHHQE